MIGHHVAQSAGAFIEAPTVLNSYSLGYGDLNVVNMVAVPERLENAVCEAQHQDVLDRFLSEEVIDPIDLVFGQHLEDLRVEGFGRCQIVPEGFLNDHPPPGVLRLEGEPGVAELLDDGAEEPFGDRQIEQDIGCIVLLPLLCQQLLEAAKGFGLREVSTHIVHAAHELRPGLLVDRLALSLVPACACRGLHHLGQAPTPPFGGPVIMIDANDGEAVRKLPGSNKIVDRRHDETLGQISASTEDHQDCGRRLAPWNDLCRGLCGFRRDRCHRTDPPTHSVFSTGCGGRGMACLTSRSMLALLSGLLINARRGNFVRSRFLRLDQIGASPQLHALGPYVAALDEAAISLDDFKGRLLALAPETDVKLMLADAKIT